MDAGSGASANSGTVSTGKGVGREGTAVTELSLRVAEADAGLGFRASDPLLPDVQRVGHCRGFGKTPSQSCETPAGPCT